MPGGPSQNGVEAASTLGAYGLLGKTDIKSTIFVPCMDNERVESAVAQRAEGANVTARWEAPGRRWCLLHVLISEQAWTKECVGEGEDVTHPVSVMEYSPSLSSHPGV